MMANLVSSIPFTALAEWATTLGAVVQPLIVFAIFKLVHAWTKFDKSVALLAKSVEDLNKRIEKIESKVFKD